LKAVEGQGNFLGVEGANQATYLAKIKNLEKRL
jgi:hypothetical protein